MKFETPSWEGILEDFTKRMESTIAQSNSGLETFAKRIEDTMVKSTTGLENTVVNLLQPLTTRGQGPSPRQSTPTCYGCGAVGHYRSNCPQRQGNWSNNVGNGNSSNVPASQTPSRPPPTCYNCGVVGHTRNRCPALGGVAAASPSVAPNQTASTTPPSPQGK